jgi:hypothetical protein
MELYEKTVIVIMIMDFPRRTLMKIAMTLTMNKAEEDFMDQEQEQSIKLKDL